VRPGDLALRLGGDEFAVVLRPGQQDPATLRRSAREQATALREAVDRTDWERVAPGLRISVSVGVAAARVGPGMTRGADALYREADADLYVDKASPAKGTASGTDPSSRRTVCSPHSSREAARSEKDRSPL
jgi:diguanylate cyclase